MSQFHRQQQNNVQVRILEDENNSLHELFKAAFDPASQKQVPLYQRNLPKSFFVQPTGINSEDGFSPQTNEETGNFHLKNPATSGLIISHSKAHSSPACLDATHLVAANQMQCDNHERQKSLDITKDEFYNSLNQQQSQSSSHFSSSKFQRQQHSQNIGSNERTNQKIPTPAPRNQQAPFNQHAQLKFQISELDPCYEMAVNEGKVYFLDHTTQNTSWYDPRIPQEFQQWGMTLENLEQLHLAYARELMARNSQEGISSSEVYSRQQSVTQPHARSFSQPTSMAVQQMSTPALFSSLSSSSSLPGAPPPGPPLVQVLEGLHLTGAQHSHQGSLDSGVGPSVTGQTPERAMQQYESEMGGCEIPPEFLESMGYDSNYPNINLLDGFDMNELGNV